MSEQVAAAHEITSLLLAHARGDPRAMDRLMPLVYARLRTIAHHRLA